MLLSFSRTTLTVTPHLSIAYMQPIKPVKRDLCFINKKKENNMPKNNEKEKRIQQYVNSIQGLFKPKIEPKEQQQQQTPEDNKSKRPSSSS